MSQKEIIEVDGVIEECLPDGKFKVKLVNDHIIHAHLSGKMRSRSINVILADWVKVEMSPYDLEKGRIVFRYKQNPQAQKIDDTEEV